MFIRLASISLLLFATAAAHADTVYTYTGQNFTDVHGIYSTSDHVSGYFVLTDPIPANSTDVTVFPVAYSFSDGIQTSALPESSGEFLDISTDAAGNLTEYAIVILTLGDGNIQIDRNSGFSGDSGEIRSLVEVDQGTSLVPGTFTISTTSATPEPSSFMLLGTGLLGIAGLLKRTYRSS